MILTGKLKAADVGQNRLWLNRVIGRSLLLYTLNLVDLVIRSDWPHLDKGSVRAVVRQLISLHRSTVIVDTRLASRLAVPCFKRFGNFRVWNV